MRRRIAMNLEKKFRRYLSMLLLCLTIFLSGMIILGSLPSETFGIAEGEQLDGTSEKYETDLTDEAASLEIDTETDRDAVDSENEAQAEVEESDSESEPQPDDDEELEEVPLRPFLNNEIEVATEAELFAVLSILANSHAHSRAEGVAPFNESLPVSIALTESIHATEIMYIDSPVPVYLDGGGNTLYGSIYQVEGDLTLTNITLCGSRASEVAVSPVAAFEAFGDGYQPIMPFTTGVIVNGGQTHTIGAGTVVENHATRGVHVMGSISGVNGGTLNLLPGGTIRNNGTLGVSNGGGVLLADNFGSGLVRNTFNMTGGRIYNNRGFEGGGVYVGMFSNFNIGSTVGYAEIVGNRVEGVDNPARRGGNGGGVYIDGNGTITADRIIIGSGTRISDNTAVGAIVPGSDAALGDHTGNGGGIYTSRSLEIGAGVVISNNRAFTRSSGGNTGSGGGIHLHSNGQGASIKRLTITGGEIYGNTAQLNGGGINIISSSFSHGPGLFTHGAAEFHMSGGEIRDNEANGLPVTPEDARPSIPTGGGVCIRRGQLGGEFIKSGGVIRDNWARGFGGGIYLGASGVQPTQRITFTMRDDALIENNRAGYYPQVLPNQPGGRAGGIRIQNNSHVIMEAGTIRGNVANWGSAIDMHGSSLFRMESGTIGGVAHADGNFGGTTIYNNNGRFELQDGYIIGNRSFNQGGAIQNNVNNALTNGVFMSGGVIANNTASGNANAHGGGAIYNRGRVVMSGGVIRNNTTARNGGGIWTDGTGAINGFYMSGDAAIYGNTANGLGLLFTGVPSVPLAVGGGGVFVTNNGRFTMEGGIIGGPTSAHANHSTRAHQANARIGGAGVTLATPGSQFIMTAGRIENNIAAGDGGGVHNNGGTMTFTGAGAKHMIHNTAGRNGGGVAWEASVDGAVSGQWLTAANTGAVNITDNTAGASGGGIHTSAGTFTINNNWMIADNTAVVHGNGVNLEGSELIIAGGTITNNHGASMGGGINLIDAANVTMNAGTINNNSAGRGGGLSAYNNATINMSSGAITNNNATTYGGGVHLGTNNATFNATGGSITGNIAGLDGGGIWTSNHQYYSNLLTAGAYSNVTTSTNVIFGNNEAGNGAFIPPSNWDITGIRGNGVSTPIGDPNTHQLNNYDVNFRNNFNLRFYKVCSNLHIHQDPTHPDVEFLDGAVFRVYRYTGSGTPAPGLVTSAGINAGLWEFVIEYISGASGEVGQVNLEPLVPGVYYQLIETVAPSGFQAPLDGQWRFILDSSGEPTFQSQGTGVLAFLSFDGDYFLANIREWELPLTGGLTNGQWFLLTGISLMTVGVVIVVYKMRKMNKDRLMK